MLMMVMMTVMVSAIPMAMMKAKLQLQVIALWWRWQWYFDVDGYGLDDSVVPHDFYLLRTTFMNWQSFGLRPCDVCKLTTIGVL